MRTSPPVNLPLFPQPSSLLIPPRIDAPELLDLGAGSAQDVQANFADLWRINRLGGIQALTQHLYPRLKQHQESLTLVDVGAGSGDIAAAIAQWAQHARLDLSIWGLDLSPRSLTVARLRHSLEERIHLIQADGLHLPFRQESVDYFISCLFLHHLTPEQVKTLLVHTFECARRGIIMSDVVRGRLPLLAFKLSQPVFARNYLTRHDGAVSIQRAYTASELLQLAWSAGLVGARVYQHFPWRMTLVVDK